LLDLPRARVRAYRPETSIAEKTEAMVRLALANSRMKDFFDIWRLAMSRPFDGETFRLAISATFERRQTPLPSLTDEFGADPRSAANGMHSSVGSGVRITPTSPKLLPR